jgi:hypothetical protein
MKKVINEEDMADLLIQLSLNSYDLHADSALVLPIYK